MRTAASSLAILLAIAGAATAQEQEASVNESDFDTTAPPPDESYLEDDATDQNGPSRDPDVVEDDFDTSVPAPDESYLDAAPSGAPEDERATPIPAFAALLALAGAAFVGRKR